MPAQAKAGKSRRQVGYLLSKASPLSEAQKRRLKGELESGEVRVRPRKKGGKRK